MHQLITLFEEPITSIEDLVKLGEEKVQFKLSPACHGHPG